MLPGDTAQCRCVVEVWEICISSGACARDDFQHAPLLAVLFQHEQFQGFDTTARVRCQERLAERWQPRKRTHPECRLLEKSPTIRVVAYDLMFHHFSLVVSSTWAMRFT
jgi:hypothetical protein